MNMTKKKSILIPDSDGSHLMNIVDCFSRKKDFHIHIMSNQKRLPMRYSRFVQRWTYYRDTADNNEWIQKINEVLKKYDIDVILPLSEIVVRRIIANKSLLLNPNKLCLLPELKNFDKARNKWTLYKHLMKFEIPCPKTKLLGTIDKQDYLNFPLIAKPTISLGAGSQIELVKSFNELEDYTNRHSFTEQDNILQEYIEGYDFSCNVLCCSGDIMAYTIQKSENQNSLGFGPQMVYGFVDNARILNLASRLMRSLKWSGIASIDLRYDTKVDDYKVLEINTRFWRSVVGSMYAGINFPVRLSNLTLDGKVINVQSYKHIKFYDMKGYFQFIRKNPLKLLDLSTLKNSTYVIRFFRDPLPYLISFYRKMNS